ncbi:hypothetical protein SAMN05880566_104235 [Janthinobacterium sp. TND4EL3]|uniref:hypothetical protein n=1 Tax=Janthinobacterium sp. TND4EL3 TaxID=1907311 RepID=UPI0009547B35|nr:hypothetical protein [Janthinobacterium sp. TND4EL3]SIQ61433.1 hypothetical protein SAMN05880566_104235 [Janthinobacterium sp. TND4EL3]
MNLARLRLLLSLFSLCALALFALCFLAGSTLVTEAYQGRSLPLLNKLLAHAGRHPLDFYISKMYGVLNLCLLLWCVFTLTAALTLHRLRRPALSGKDWLDHVMFVVYTAAFGYILLYFGVQRSWYVIDKIMAYEGAPPFQHRVMFVFPAQVLQYAVPQLGALQSFLWSQVLAVVLMLWSVRRFATLFIRSDLAFIGQFLILCIWAPTLHYYTFYDIGIIFVYSFCLYHLLRRELLPYVAMLVAGTFNHEITLFLIVTSGFVFLGHMRWRSLAAFLALQLILYFLVRLLMFYLLPAHQAWEGGKLGFNLNLLLNDTRGLVYGLAPLLLWYLLAATGWRHAPLSLRRCTIILPCLIAMTALVGQFNEARQFDAFIPVAMALMLCSLSARLDVPAKPSPAGDSVWTSTGFLKLRAERPQHG